MEAGVAYVREHLPSPYAETTAIPALALHRARPVDKALLTAADHTNWLPGKRKIRGALSLQNSKAHRPTS
jgi:hypothetical protein